MGHKRQLNRAARHTSGEIDVQKREWTARRAAPFIAPFKSTIYYVTLGSEVVKCQHVYGTSSMEGRLLQFSKEYPDGRIIKVKKGDIVHRWQKKPKPPSLTRQMKDEAKARAEYRAIRRLAVIRKEEQCTTLDSSGTTDASVEAVDASAKTTNPAEVSTGLMMKSAETVADQ